MRGRQSLQPTVIAPFHKTIFITMKKTYLKPETELISIKFGAIMLTLSQTNADKDLPVLDKERNFVNFAEGNGIEE